MQQYVSVRSERRLPRRWTKLTDRRVWCRGSVCHRHGLCRLRRTLQVPAVSAAAVAAAATLAAATLTAATFSTALTTAAIATATIATAIAATDVVQQYV